MYEFLNIYVYIYLKCDVLHSDQDFQFFVWTLSAIRRMQYFIEHTGDIVSYSGVFGIYIVFLLVICSVVGTSLKAAQEV